MAILGDPDDAQDALETSPAATRQLLYEARRGLREMGEGREMSCDAVTAILSEGDGRVLRRRDVRAHLRDCRDCREFAAEIDDRRETLAAIPPLPVAVAAALLKGALASAGGAAVGGAAGGAVGGAGGSVGVAAGLATKAGSAVTIVKSAAGVIAIVAVGAVAADQAQVLHLGGGHGGSPSRAAAGGGADRIRPEERFDDAGRPRVVIPAPAPRPAPPAAVGRRVADAADRARVGDRVTAPGRSDVASAVSATTSTGGHQPTARSRQARGAGRSASGAGTHHPAHPTHPAHPAHPSHPTGSQSSASEGKPAASPSKQDHGSAKPTVGPSEAPDPAAGSEGAVPTVAGDAAAPPDVLPGQAKKAACEAEAETG